MSTKLAKAAYDRIVLQAEEARDLGLTKLANSVFEVVGPVAREEKLTYNEEDLVSDAEAVLWKIATDVVAYHDLKNVDIQEIESAIEGLAARVVAGLEQTLGVEGQTGALEEVVPGQK